MFCREILEIDNRVRSSAVESQPKNILSGGKKGLVCLAVFWPKGCPHFDECILRGNFIYVGSSFD